MANRDLSYGSMPVDQNHNPIPSGTSIKTSDSTASIKSSPLAYSNTVITLTIPSNAAEVVFLPSTAMRVSESVGMSTYYVIPASTAQAISVSRMDFIYIVRDAADGTLSFYFVLI